MVDDNTVEELEQERVDIFIQIKNLELRLGEIDKEILAASTSQASPQKTDIISDMCSPSPLKCEVQFDTPRNLWDIGTSGFELVDGEGRIQVAVGQSMGYGELSPRNFHSLSMPPTPNSGPVVGRSPSEGGELTQLIHAMGD